MESSSDKGVPPKLLSILLPMFPASETSLSRLDELFLLEELFLRIFDVANILEERIERCGMTRWDGKDRIG